MPLFTVILGDATDMMGDASGETSYVDSMEEVALQHYGTQHQQHSTPLLLFEISHTRWVVVAAAIRLQHPSRATTTVVRSTLRLRDAAHPTPHAPLPRLARDDERQTQRRPYPWPSLALGRPARLWRLPPPP